MGYLIVTLMILIMAVVVLTICLREKNKTIAQLKHEKKCHETFYDCARRTNGVHVLE